MKITILFATLILLTSASAQTPQTSKVAEEISRLLEKHRTDYLRGDADAWAALYAEDAVFTGFKRSMGGRQTIREYFAQVFRDFPHRTVNVSSLKIRVYNESGSPTVVLNVEDTGSRIDASGKQIPLNARESLIWVRIQGKWLIVNHQATPMQ
jgi:uncharacterized protein (TIGR02246 family)